MRTAIIIMVAAALVAACGEGSAFDDSFKASYVEKGVEACVRTAGARGPAPAGVRYDVLCRCLMEQHVAGRSAMELMQEQESAADAEIGREMEQCIAQSGAGSAAGKPVAAEPAN